MNSTTRFSHLLAVMLVALSISLPASSAGPGVVYHIDSSDRAVGALRNVANHRKAYPDLPITVVALGDGVRFLVDGSKDAHGNSFASMVEPLALAGVKFNACANTLNALSIDPEELSFGVETVPSGVAEIGRLQLEEYFAYIKP